MKTSKLGYKRNSPDKNEKKLLIKSGKITMKGVDFPVLGTDNLGNQIMMMPGQDYQFPGSEVTEIPIKQEGGENPLIKKYGQYVDKRFDWIPKVKQKVDYSSTNKPFYQITKDIAKEYGLDPSTYTASVYEEGAAANLYPDKKGEVYFTGDDEFPVPGFEGLGLDRFGERFPEFVKKGYLKKEFKDRFKVYEDVNEKGTKIRSADFKTVEDALRAKAAFIAAERDQFNKYTKEKKVTLTPEAQNFFELAAYNQGQTGAREMFKYFQENKLLDNNVFLTQKPEKYQGVYENVMRRIQGAAMLKGETGVFQKGGVNIPGSTRQFTVSDAAVKSRYTEKKEEKEVKESLNKIKLDSDRKNDDKKATEFLQKYYEHAVKNVPFYRDLSSIDSFSARYDDRVRFRPQIDRLQSAPLDEQYSKDDSMSYYHGWPEFIQDSKIKNKLQEELAAAYQDYRRKPINSLLRQDSLLEFTPTSWKDEDGNIVSGTFNNSKLSTKISDDHRLNTLIHERSHKADVPVRYKGISNTKEYLKDINKAYIPNNELVRLSNNLEYLSDFSERQARHRTTQHWLSENFSGYDPTKPVTDKEYEFLIKNRKNLPSDVEQLITTYGANKDLYLKNINSFQKGGDIQGMGLNRGQVSMQRNVEDVQEMNRLLAMVQSSKPNNPKLSSAKPTTTYSKAKKQDLNQQYAATHPEYNAQDGNLVPSPYGRFRDKYQKQLEGAEEFGEFALTAADIAGAAALGKMAIKKLAAKKLSKSGVDDLGIYTEKQGNKYYNLGEGFGDNQSLPETKGLTSSDFGSKPKTVREIKDAFKYIRDKVDKEVSDRLLYGKSYNFDAGEYKNYRTLDLYKRVFKEPFVNSKLKNEYLDDMYTQLHEADKPIISPVKYPISYTERDLSGFNPETGKRFENFDEFIQSKVKEHYKKEAGKLTDYSKDVKISDKLLQKNKPGGQVKKLMYKKGGKIKMQEAGQYELPKPDNTPVDLVPNTYTPGQYKLPFSNTPTQLQKRQKPQVNSLPFLNAFNFGLDKWAEVLRNKETDDYQRQMEMLQNQPATYIPEGQFQYGNPLAYQGGGAIPEDLSYMAPIFDMPTFGGTSSQAPQMPEAEPIPVPTISKQGKVEKGTFAGVQEDVAMAAEEILNMFPKLRVTSTVRSWGDKDAHPKGRAVDVTGPYKELQEAWTYYKLNMVKKYGFNKALPLDHGTGLHGHVGYYQHGGEYNLSPEQILELEKQGYKFETL